MLIDRLKAWWSRKLDNDSVRQWVPPYCAIWLTWGILAVFWLPPVDLIEDGMGHIAYEAWLWISIFANLGPIVGLWMREGGETVEHIMNMTTPFLLKDWMGLSFQAGGHAIASLMLLQFQIAAWIGVSNYTGPNAYAGLTVFAACMLLPWTFGSALLSAQCCRKIQKALQLEGGFR